MALVFVNLDDLVTVVRLACLTEDRSNTEQRALLRVARKADTIWNKSTNGSTWERVVPRGMPPGFVRLRDLLVLEDEVDRSRELVDDQRSVKLPEKGRWKMDQTMPVYVRVDDQGDDSETSDGDGNGGDGGVRPGGPEV